MFHTLELSDPRFERDHLRFITVKSQHLKGRGDISVFVPPGTETQTLPAVILLHGVYGSHWAWAFSGGAHLTAQRMIESGEIDPMVLIMPSDGLWGDGSGYLRHTSYDFEAWIIQDVRNAAMECIPQVNKDSPWCVNGLSMGGFGALRIGAKYADQFQAIHAHSAITHIDQIEDFVEEPLIAYHQHTREEASIIQLMESNRSQLPPIRFDCGISDSLIEPNRVLHQQLEEKGIAHTYVEHEGAHNWTYWEKHLPDALRFFWEELRKN